MHLRPRHATRRKRLAVLWTAFVLLLYTLTGRAVFDQPYFGLTLRGDRIARVDLGGPAERAGIAANDLLLAVNGSRVDRMPFLGEKLYAGALGDRLDLEVIGAAGHRRVIVEAATKPADARWEAAAALVTGIGFLMIGLYVALQRERRLTMLFFYLCSGFSVVLLPIAPAEPPVMPLIVGTARNLAALFLPPLILHFFLLFPRPRPVVRTFPALLRWIYVPAMVSLPPLIYVSLSGQWNAPLAPVLMIALEKLVELCFIVYALLALLSFVLGYRRVRSLSERHRYSVVLWGTLIGIAPLLLGTLVHAVWGDARLPLERLTMISLLLVPLSFAYAIVRHRIFDIEIFVKRSVVSSILTACLVVITVGIYAIFGNILEGITGGRSRWVMFASLLIIAAIFSPLRRRIEGLVDRTFFRDRYDDRRVLRELGQALPAILDLRHLLVEVVEKLSRTLRVREAAIFLSMNDSRDLRVAYVSGLPVEDIDLPPIPRRFMHIVLRERRPLRTVEIEESLPFGALNDAEDRLLTVFEGGVIVPLGSGSELVAVLLLGRRAGGETYGFEDLELLRAIAGQATVAMRNALLHARAMEQERLRRELAVARDLQQHLLPSKNPVFARIEIAGSTSPCSEVGGDFYDYLSLPGDRLGLAVGDVSGHGIPAALLMASLSATLRAEAERNPDPGTLLERVNDRACDALEPGQFLSLFYGVLSPQSLTITYANAGHPPPLLIQSDGKVIELATGGLLLGVDRDSRYRTDTLTCPPGAVILFYTDGLVEARREEEEFGEERIVELVREHPTLTAEALRARIMRAVSEFVGEDLADDVTLIVLRGH